jgi:hypothetical protein
VFGIGTKSGTPQNVAQTQKNEVSIFQSKSTTTTYNVTSQKSGQSHQVLVVLLELDGPLLALQLEAGWTSRRGRLGGRGRRRSGLGLCR